FDTREIYSPPNDSLPFISPRQDSLSEYEYINFGAIAYADFEVFKRGWYVVMNQQLSSGEVLGAYVEYERRYQTGEVDTFSIGNLSFRPDTSEAGDNDTTLVLQLLQHSQPTVEFETWERMWRNVYDLGSRNISPDGFEMRIYKGNGSPPGNINDFEDQNGQCFVTILGLDNQNNSDGSSSPDCLTDYNNTIMDAARGHIVFPESHPFENEGLDIKVPQIYRYPYNNPKATDSTVYYLHVKTSERGSTYSLGRANIIEGSEVVRLQDGTTLKRGVDYNINYDIGQITFISQEAMNPGANVSVDFEFAPFFMPEKKTLFGFAGQYQIFDKSNISLAAMYRKETASDPRPRVGREPRKGFVWDANFSFKFEPDFMTTMIDILPLIETDAKSSLDISGEVAQSLPNPNTKNQAFIDDFEGTRNFTDLTSRRGIWTACSPPILFGTTKAELYNKADLWWYNPYDAVKLTDIWEERDVKPQDNRIDVLDIRFFPNMEVANPESTWAGIMRSLYTGMADQSLSKFIEFWYLPDATVPNGAPTMHINLGLISEDLDNDEFKDTEDADNNNVFDPEAEDTGLDGVFDEGEEGFDPGIPDHDPSGDNWSYNPQNNPYDYSGINGTERNKDDPDRLGRFDTEDINYNGSLDRQDGYFEYSIDLDNPEYLVDSTTSGWRLLRIPLQDASAIDTMGIASSADFTRISFARLWFDNATIDYFLRIASFRLVGNKWQELTIAYPDGDTLRPDEKFEVTTKNTHENLNYEPPPGIAGELDRETGLREKEQSLVLSYQNMSAGHVAGAYWNLFQPEDYTQYQKLKMYVHGDSSSADSNITFFFRMTQDGANFYEYHTVLQPDWVDGNWVEIDFIKLTNLKYELHKTLPDSIPLSEADTTDGNYRVFGNPSLSQVKMFIVGIEIAEDLSGLKTGEVWLDELRVTDIRKKSDFAGRIQANLKFSDLIDLGLSYQKMGADFFPLSAKKSSGATTSSRSARLRVAANKLFPPSLGLSLPLNYSWQKTLSLPRLKPGSDVILLENARDEQRTESEQRSYGGNLSFNKRTPNPIWNLTLNRITANYTYSRTVGSSPATPTSDLVRYQGKGTYDYQVSKKPSFKPFGWTKYLFIPQSFSNSEFSYVPSKIGFSAEVNGNNTMNKNLRGIITAARKKDLSLAGNISFEPFSNLRSNYSRTSLRDLTDEKYFKPSINPSKLKLGREVQFGQRFDASFQPKFANILDNRFSFNSTYNENSDFKRNLDSTRTTDLQGSIKGDFTLKISQLFPRAKRGNPPRQRERKGKDKIDDQGPDEKKNGEADDELDDDDLTESRRQISPLQILKKIAGTVKTIKPIRASIQKDKRLNKQGLIERPSWKYRFAFSDNPQAAVKSTGGLVGSDNTTSTDTYNIDSGFQPFGGFDITTSYNRRISINRRGTTDPTETKSITFPSVTLNISGIEKISLFKSFARTVGWQFSYSKKMDETGNADTDELYTRETEKRYAPLASLTLNFRGNIRGSIRYDKTTASSKNLKSAGQSDRQVERNDGNLKLNVTYTFSAPKGLKLPLLKRIKFNSQLSVSLDIGINSSKSESITSGRKSVDVNRKSTSIEPKLSYQFSKAITGGLRARWNDSDDKIQKRKHHVRELGIWTEIRF
ncbi:MAG: cell surface protein SprA, partial [candidate division Zixibacteria bacterium]